MPSMTAASNRKQQEIACLRSGPGYSRGIPNRAPTTSDGCCPDYARECDRHADSQHVGSPLRPFRGLICFGAGSFAEATHIYPSVLRAGSSVLPFSVDVKPLVGTGLIASWSFVWICVTLLVLSALLFGAADVLAENWTSERRRASRAAFKPVVQHPPRRLSGHFPGSTDRLLDQGAHCALNCLWRLSECPDERTPHPLPISKTVLPGNFLG